MRLHGEASQGAGRWMFRGEAARWGCTRGGESCGRWPICCWQAFVWAEFCWPSCLADFCWPIFVGRIIRIAGPKCYAELSELLAKDRNVVNEIIGQELIAILIVHSLSAKSVHKTN